MRRSARGATGILTLAGMLVLAACGPGQPDASRAPDPPSAASPSSGPSADAPQTLATGLQAPWSVLPLADGGALISERDDGDVIELTPTGEQRTAGTIPDVVSGGESGLHGLALYEEDGIRWLYAYHGAADDNRVVRMPLIGEPSGLELDLDARETVIDGIPRARNHNGGRIAFGPDGMLYIATGDAGQRDRAGDPDFLGGKILRVTPQGDPAPGNPLGGPVHSVGHRNVQGLAWDEDEVLWASEFGQDAWDELNRIEAGGDYGWPEHEGLAGADDAIDPVVVWSPDEASPSGIAVIDGTVFIAGLRGERLWVVDVVDGAAEALHVGEFGRLRDVVAGPHGTIWVLTNNTDGRGAPRDGDDRLLQLPIPEG